MRFNSIFLIGYNVSERTVEQHIYNIERKNLEYSTKQKYLSKTRPKTVLVT